MMYSLLRISLLGLAFTAGCSATNQSSAKESNDSHAATHPAASEAPANVPDEKVAPPEIDLCAASFDLNLKCNEHTTVSREQLIEKRDMAMQLCQREMEKEERHPSLICATKSSCEEFDQCIEAIRSERRQAKYIAEIEGYLTDGKTRVAFNVCNMNLERILSSPGYKAVCENAFTAFFASQKMEELIPTLRYLCVTEHDKWKEAISAIRPQCDALQSFYKARIETSKPSDRSQRASDCEKYQEVVKTLSPDLLSAAERLCATTK